MNPTTKRYHRGTQVVRQWRIIRLLLASPSGLTAAEIAKSLRAHERTIYRDLEQLRDAGFPIIWRGPQGRREAGTWHIWPAGMTGAEERFFRGVDPDA